VYLYDPDSMYKIVHLLRSGAIMNTRFDVFEVCVCCLFLFVLFLLYVLIFFSVFQKSHIPFLLQFLVDYHCYGMNWLNLSTAQFRLPLPKHQTVKIQFETGIFLLFIIIFFL
jgi:hypothetical protein